MSIPAISKGSFMYRVRWFWYLDENKTVPRRENLCKFVRWFFIHLLVSIPLTFTVSCFAVVIASLAGLILWTLWNVPGIVFGIHGRAFWREDEREPCDGDLFKIMAGAVKPKKIPSWPLQGTWRLLPATLIFLATIGYLGLYQYPTQTADWFIFLGIWISSSVNILRFLGVSVMMLIFVATISLIVWVVVKFKRSETYRTLKARAKAWKQGVCPIITFE